VAESIIAVSDLLNAYSQGLFPMADHKDNGPIYWYEPKWRGIIPMEGFNVSKNVRRMIRNQHYSITIDADFEGVMQACAEREESWISPQIIDSYVNLHQFGFAHSVEVWTKEGTQLVGGLYGVRIKKAFFGESMFKRAAEADKVALWHAHQWLLDEGITLWDTQFWTEHLAQFGCIEISQAKYLRLLTKALSI
jgi:leucyl/phenylalanyl-tRNA--protein transferase